MYLRVPSNFYLRVGVDDVVMTGADFQHMVQQCLERAENDNLLRQEALLQGCVETCAPEIPTGTFLGFSYFQYAKKSFIIYRQVLETKYLEFGWSPSSGLLHPHYLQSAES